MPAVVDLAVSAEDAEEYARWCRRCGEPMVITKKSAGFSSFTGRAVYEYFSNCHTEACQEACSHQRAWFGFGDKCKKCGALMSCGDFF
jgi:hypothetical protein